MVVNICRPFSATVRDIVSAMRNIEAASGLAVTGLVSNTNLGAETEEHHVIAGLQRVREVSGDVGLPLRWLVLPAWLDAGFAPDVPIFPLQPRTTYPWDE